MKIEPLTLIAGPCVIENENLVYEVAGSLKNICNKEKTLTFLWILFFE